MAFRQTTWSTMMICAVDWCELWSYLQTCEVMWKYMFFLRILGDHVRLWVCFYECSLRVDARLLLIDYMSLWWLFWWCGSNFYDFIKMTRVILKCFKEWYAICYNVKNVVSFLIDFCPLLDTCMNDMWKWYVLTR